MERTEAVQLVATTIARYPHVTHLRLTTRGSFSGRSRIEVMTLGQPGVKRPKGTREQEYIGFEGDMFARPDDLPASTWFEVFEALDPDIRFAGGCAEQTGFDVDAAGNITNRRGSKTQAAKAERKFQQALARMNAGLDAELDAAAGAFEAQRHARIVRGPLDPRVRIYPVHVQQAGRIDRSIQEELTRKAGLQADLKTVALHDQLEDADKNGPMPVMVDLDAVTVDYSTMLGSFLGSSDHAEFKRAMLDLMLSTGKPTPVIADRRDETL